MFLELDGPGNGSGSDEDGVEVEINTTWQRLIKLRELPRHIRCANRIAGHCAKRLLHGFQTMCAPGTFCNALYTHVYSIYMLNYIFKVISHDDITELLKKSRNHQIATPRHSEKIVFITYSQQS